MVPHGKRPMRPGNRAGTGGEGGPGSSSPDAAASALLRPAARLGLLFFVLMFVVYAGVSLAVVARAGLLGLVGVQVVCLLLPSLLYLKKLGLLSRLLSLETLPEPQHLEVPILLGVSVWYFLLVIALPLQQLVLPVPQEFIDQRASFFTPQGGTMAWIGVLLASAACPAVCEEIFFRGVLLQCFRGSGSNLMAVIVVSVLFSLFHFNPYQISVTFLQGLILGLLMVWSGSLVAPMLFHFFNNAMVILVTAMLPEADPTQSLPVWGLGVASMPLSVGVILLIRDIRARDRREPKHGESL